MVFQLLSPGGNLLREAYTEFGLVQPDKPTEQLEKEYTNEASEFLELDEARVHYRDEGPEDAQTIVALHGTYSSLHTWDGWVEQLGDEYRIVRLDMPGFGLTGPREGRHTLRALVETVGQLCDELGVDEAAVAGNSLGGGVAWRLSIERPELVSKLLLLNAGGATLLSILSSNLMDFVGPAVQRYVTPRVFARLMLMDAYYDTTKVTDDLVRRYHDLMLRSGNRRAVVDIARNYEADHFDDTMHELRSQFPSVPSVYRPRPHVWDGYNIANVPAPALFQWGAEDTWLSESFGRELADRTPNSRFISYERVGHVSMEESPERTAADAAEFLEE